MSKADSENVEVEDDGLKEFLAPLHEQWLVRGTILASYLDDMGENLRVQISTPEEIDQLRYEFRHAPSLVGASVAAIRCAVAITDFSAALEGLVFQKRRGAPSQLKLLGTGEVKVEDRKQLVQAEYFVERIAEAIFCKKEIASKLFNGMVVLLYQQVIDLPVFNTEVKGRFVYLNHNGK